jgi:homopolymeric O-antigen transport system permease protein
MGPKTLVKESKLNIKGWISNFLKYRFLVGELVVREIKIKYKRSALGILWSVLNPLMMMVILNFVFSSLFRFDIPNFLVYYLTGYLLFLFMQEATGGSLFSIIGNTGLITKVYIPKYVFPFAKTVSALVNLGFALIPLIFVAAFTGVKASLALLSLPVLFLTVFMFVLGLALIFATLTVFFRDMIHFHGILMLMWMYLTPIFYPEKIIPTNLRWVLDANPMYFYIKAFREIVLEGKFPSGNLSVWCAGVGTVSLLIGLLVFKRNQNRFTLYF